MEEEHMKRILILILLSVPVLSARAGRIDLRQWEIAREGTDVWYPAEVPATVLSVLVRNGIFPDPRTGMDNFRIPDVSEEGSPFRDPWWYRTEFNLSRDMASARHIWLNLDGINYRADIYVNGTPIARHEDVVGMFRRFRFDIRDAVRAGKNTVSIRIHQVDHPGVPSPGRQILLGPNRGNAADLFLDETLKFSGGWDCAPVVRDRNMGIWQPVYITATGDVTVENPYVVTRVPDTSLARIVLEATLVNHADKPVRGTLEARISPEEDPKKALSLRLPVTLQAGETRTVLFDTLTVRNPDLWWPNGYGGQPLQVLELAFRSGNRTSDRTRTLFGIREVQKELMDKEGEKGLVFRINGTRIFARGGWLQPDCLLDNSRKNVFTQARLLAHAGVNIVGSEDMPSPPEDWVESWDRYGLMDWHVFYQCYRMYPGRANAHNPLDHDLALACARDMILRYRNHPSIVAWFGVNEVMFDEDLYVATREAARELDPSRPFIPTTSISWDVEKLTPWILDDLPTGTTDDGAPDYNWAPSDYYFRKVKEVHLQMFRNEMGMPAVPVERSLRRFIPTLDRPRESGDFLFPLDSIWGEHGAWDVNNFCFRSYDNAIRTLWGDPATAASYIRGAQIVSAEGYRAMFEAAGHRMWDITTGAMLWKLNACWPDVCWQFYDWYLVPNAAYYFSKKALETLHIQLNADTRTISVINQLPITRKGLRVRVRVIGNDLREHWRLERDVDLPGESFTELGEVPVPLQVSAVYLVRMELEDADGNLLSENLYWDYTQHQSLYWLATLPQVDLHPQLTVSDAGAEWELEVVLSNQGNTLAFFQEVRLEQDGIPVDPVFWDDNFISLFPGERRVLHGRVPKEDAPGKLSIAIE